MRSVRVALIGANGHGRSHRRTIARLHTAGLVTLVGLADLAPIRDEPDAPVPAGVRLFEDYRDLLAATGPELVVICTPPHTHLEIATAAARAGADLLLEKPPLTTLAEHATLTGVLAETGRVCQVGFQALGSAALAELVAAVAPGRDGAPGRLGKVTGISAVGAWQRPDAYYQRAPWAGRRWLAGRPVLDGALANPFAHAVMQCLAIPTAGEWGGGPVELSVELARYRARPIEVDDTAVLRAHLGEGPPIVVAVTLCADEHLEPTVTVHTEQGRAVLEYTTDRLRLPGEPALREVPGRTGLLENLLAHRAWAVPLLAALARTEPFTALVEAIAGAPEPSAIAPAYQRSYGDGAERTVTVPGVSELLRRAADQLALPSELGVAWSAPAFRTATRLSVVPTADR
jgi:predicted dehydrogenase